jgi:ssDNA-binding Zn-finger/Zn-ribbon topoisomerase 1
MRKGKWGYFVGCSEYETESKCPGKLTIPCPDKNCDGYLVCRNRKEDGGIFLGCNNFSEKNCRQGKDFDTAIYLANEILKKRAANKWDSSTRPPIKDFKKVNPALQDNIPI